MVDSRMAPLLDALTSSGGPGLDSLAGVSAVECARLLGLSGVSVSLLGGAGDQLAGEPVWHSAEPDIRLADLHFVLGEGPTVEAAQHGSPILEADLDLVPDRRWPAFLPVARLLRVRALFAFPLRIGAVRLGAFTGWRSTPGRLTDRELGDALLFADSVTARLTGRDTDHLTDAAEGSHDLYRAEVHQATGMVSVQLGVPPGEALVRLRAYAYSRERPILAVAKDVVERRLRFGAEPWEVDQP